MAYTDLLVTLLVKVATFASLASIALRWNFAKRLFLREQRTIRQRLELAAQFGVVFASASLVRVVLGYRAAEVGLEGAFVSGLVGGYVPGAVAGALISLPAVLGPDFEWATLPLLVGVGSCGGLLRSLAPDPEDVWRFSPFFVFSLVAWIRNRIPGSEGAFQLTMLTACVGLELLRIQIARTFSQQELLFSLYDSGEELSLVPVAFVCGATVMGVGLTIKVWNNTRNEWKIENQQRLLSEARLMSLTRQMNPHFLFNTLNSVASLARTDPDKAREMIYRLSTILRRLLRKQEAFVPLSEELSVIDDYLQIEQVRFAGRLQIEKIIDKESMDALVPSMILQPIVENSIKHGIEPKVGTGTVRLGSSLKSGRLQIEIEDDGVGIPHEDMASLFQKGIGLGNARERLEVLFGQDFQLAFEARAGGGVRVRVQIPELRDAARAPENDLGSPDPV
ncbi:MAG: histidine kinase [Bryobacterales bacterium]|nr:histidine kinase [Bryobacterales bacterium]